MPQLLDRTGQRFGRLVALSEAGRDKQGRATWLCRCDCGTEKVIPSRHLGSGRTVSCGCYSREIAVERARKGARKTSESFSGSRSPHWRVFVSYASAHRRVRTARGPASHHSCADCGAWGQHWSYDLTDPGELVENGLRYSLDVDRYVSRCVPCHSAHDRLTSIGGAS